MVARGERIAKRIGGATGGLIQTFADAVGAARKPKNVGKDLMVVSSAFLAAAKMDQALTNPSDLIATHGFDKIDEMRCEETIYAVEQALFKTRLRTAWGIDPGGNEPADLKLAEEVEWMLRDMQGTLRRDLMEMWTAHAYGFSVTHKKLVEAKTPFGQRLVYERFRSIRPNSITFKLDAYGNLESIIQTVEGDATLYDPADFILYSWDKEFEDPHGRTAYRTIYRSYFSKLWNIKFWNQYLERKAGGIIVLELPPTYDEDTDGAQADKVMESIQNGTEIKLPDGWGLRVETAMGVGVSSNAYGEAVKTHNFFIAAGLLAPEHLGYTETDGGSYAKADVQKDLWLGVCEDLGRETAETVMDEQVIRPYVDMNIANFSGDYPTFRFDPLVEDDKWQMVAKVIEAMRAGGVQLLDWTLEDQDHLREQLGLPELPKDIRKLREDEQKTLSMPAAKEEPDDTDGGGSDPGEGEGGGGDGGASGEPPQTFADFPADVFADKPARRPLKGAPRHVNVREIEKRADKLEAATVEAVSKIVYGIRDDLIAKVGKIVGEGKNEPSPKLIKTLKLKHVRDIELLIRALLTMGRLAGKYDVRAEYQHAMKKPLTFAETYADVGGLYLIPAEARRYFKGLPISAKELSLISQRAFDITGILRDDILKEAKLILYKALEKGDSAWGRTELRRILDKYVETGEIKDGAVSSPHRVETIVRTNLTDAYSQGRMNMMHDPAVDSVVVGYTSSMIDDENTTDHCRDIDNVVFDKDDYEPPGYHMNCRTIGPIAVFQGEKFEIKPFPHDTVARGF